MSIFLAVDRAVRADVVHHDPFRLDRDDHPPVADPKAVALGTLQNFDVVRERFRPFGVEARLFTNERLCPGRHPGEDARCQARVTDRPAHHAPSLLILQLLDVMPEKYQLQ
ncbi:hypothetical protein [Methylobacterium flocculans]|uniref:hypothetical protein n=1 Tax=Methylobacterium flocculans TaxID=2984843 RepID=UPI0021F2F352|nr:hypothetical protein [Methylobacterium sp. FF17]